MDLLRQQVTTPALLPLTSETPPSAAFLLLLPGSLEPLWRVDLPSSAPPLPSPMYSVTPHPPPHPSRHQSLAPPVIVLAPDSYPVTPAAAEPISNSTAHSISAPDVTLLPPDTTSQPAPTTSTSPTRQLIRMMAFSDSVNQSYKESNVMEFVPLHDIPYIFLTPNKPPYLSIDEFLASPDRLRDLSTFIPNASFP